MASRPALDLNDEGDVYGDGPRPEIAALVPGSGRVLDVGCSRGAFGAELKRRQPGRVIYGIEPTAAVEHAKARLDEVAQGFYPRDVPGGWSPFDVVCFNDVLEHMVDPWEALRTAAHHLKPGGVVVASIPNVRYASNLVNLVARGRWTYTDSGILDRTHLRFFTKKTMLDLFRDCGYEVERLTGITWLGEHSRLSALSPLLLRDVAYLGFVIQAHPV